MTNNTQTQLSFITSEELIYTKITIPLKELNNYFDNKFLLHNLSHFLQELRPKIAKHYQIKSDFDHSGITDNTHSSLCPEYTMTHVHLIFIHNDKNKFNTIFFNNILYDFFSHIKQNNLFDFNDKEGYQFKYFLSSIPNWLLQHELNQSIPETQSNQNKIKI